MGAKQIAEPDVSELLSVGEAAALIGMQRAGLYYHFRHGKLRYVGIGGRRFVPLTEARRFRREHWYSQKGTKASTG